MRAWALLVYPATSALVLEGKARDPEASGASYKRPKVTKCCVPGIYSMAREETIEGSV
jgi:hypothetical protein